MGFERLLESADNDTLLNIKEWLNIKRQMSMLQQEISTIKSGCEDVNNQIEDLELQNKKTKKELQLIDEQQFLLEQKQKRVYELLGKNDKILEMSVAESKNGAGQSPVY